MVKKKITEDERDKIYAAIKLIEALFQQGKIPLYVFRNILNEHKNIIDLDEFKCCHIHS